MRPCRPPLRLSALRSREPRSASAPHTIAPTISTIIATIEIVIARPIPTPGPYLPGRRAKPGLIAKSQPAGWAVRRGPSYRGVPGLPVPEARSRLALEHVRVRARRADCTVAVA